MEVETILGFIALACFVLALFIVLVGFVVLFFILRTNKEETMKRAIERSKLDRDTNIELVQTMWEQFCNLGIYEKNVVDTTNFSISDTVLVVREKITNKACLLHK